MNARPFFLPQSEFERLRGLYPKFNEPWQTSEVEELKAMYADGISVQNISEQLGRSPKSVRMKLRSLGLYEPRPAPRTWDEADEKRLILMYNEGTSFEEIASSLGRSEKAIISRLVHLRRALFPSPINANDEIQN